VARFVAARGREAGFARVLPAGAITRGSNGESLADMAELKEAGCICVTDDGRPVMSAGVMRRALEYAADLELPVMVHAEDLTLSSGGAMNEGPVATRLGLPGIPAAAEVAMVERDLLLAELTRAHLHVAHVSAAGSVRAIREAKARGVRVTAEAAPHHFTLTDEAVAGVPAALGPAGEPFDTHAKMNPPLRSESDRQAIVGALNDGVIDAIATDHAPHGPLDKQVEFIHASNGVVGLETSLSLTLALVRAGALPLSRAVERLTIGPARAFGLPYGTLAPGAPADVVVVDPEKEWKVEPQRFFSRSRNTPFTGWTLRGRALRTYVGGKLVHSDD
jgi:dihydroorotase